jgi:hypothetical protein
MIFKSHFCRFIAPKLAALVATTLFVVVSPGPRDDANAFVLLSKSPRRLGSTPESPEVTFHWNGSTPGLKEKGKLFNGEFSEIDDADYLEQLIQLAMDQWNNVHGSYLRLVLVRDESVSANAEDRIHSITVDDEVALTAGAFATPNWNVGDDTTNTIEDCDIHLKKGSTDVPYLLATLVHELGHCVGLGHNHTNYKSIMGYSRAGDSYRLGADDMAGVIWLYPDPKVDAGAPKDLVGCGVVNRSQTSNKSPARWPAATTCFLLFFAPAALAAVATGARGRN